MATDDIRISINESDNSKMCTWSSNKIYLQISPPSNLNPHTKIEVIEGELFNSIRKPRTKCLKEDPYQLCRMSVGTNNWSLYKVPFPLRQVNEKAYEPNVISIGPYHHGKKHFETMEVIKRNCFSMMIEENNVEPGKFVTVMKNLEKEVRKCYEEPLDGFDSDTFVEMMVLDGCFIVLLFQWNNYLHTSLDKLKKGILAEICYDLLLLENQLPYFVLSELYGVITSNDEINVFSRSAFYLLSQVLPDPDICVPENFPKPGEIKHLLGLVHSSWLPSAIEPAKKGIGRKDKRSWKFIRCATELEEAGINFVKKGTALQDENKKVRLFDIEFTDDGKLKIPALTVDDNTERILRNFMAYEQFLQSSEPTYVCDYVTLMDILINSGKDVQLLCNRGIIDNWLRGDEVVAQMFNKLRDFICSSMDSDDFYYADIFDKVNDHCGIPRNQWKAKVYKDYFSTPGSIISVLAAFVMLVLTVLQTIF